MGRDSVYCEPEGRHLVVHPSEMRRLNPNYQCKKERKFQCDGHCALLILRSESWRSPPTRPEGWKDILGKLG